MSGLQQLEAAYARQNAEREKEIHNAAIDHCISLLQQEIRIGSHNKEMLITKMKASRK